MLFSDDIPFALIFEIKRSILIFNFAVMFPSVYSADFSSMETRTEKCGGVKKRSYLECFTPQCQLYYRANTPDLDK